MPPEGFVSEAEVAKFFAEVDTDLRRYGLGTVLQWRKEQLAYIRDHVDIRDGIDQIKRDFGVENFDLVLIDGSQFTGMEDFKRTRGARWIVLDDINTLKTHAVWTFLKQDREYELVHENRALRHGFAIFRRRHRSELPINFFTLVLNGNPYIRYHAEQFSQLPFAWHWQIVEGVAELHHDSSWAAALGGKVPNAANRGGLSSDGTSEYLDMLQNKLPQQVTVIRKPYTQYWDGKREMCNAVLANLTEECLLWEIDADELWTTQQIEAGRRAFAEEPDRTAARFWCNFFVGPSRVITTRYNYAQNPNQEWLRTWRFKPGMRWASHSPPVLVMKDASGAEIDVAKIRPFSQDEMEARGLVFDHCAYALESQVAFKEIYYGYSGAVREWRALQADAEIPGFLADHLSWVTDRTMFDDVKHRFIASPVGFERQINGWVVRSKEDREGEVAKLRAKAKRARRPRILIDGLCFQSGDPELARIWMSFFEAWLSSGFAENVLLLDRGGTSPRLKGLAIRSILPYAATPFGDDHQFLQRICEEEVATLFVSTGATFPVRTPSVHVAAAFPLTGSAVNEPGSRQDYAAMHASALVAFSADLANKLMRLYPERSRESVHVIQPGPLAVFGKIGIADGTTPVKDEAPDHAYVAYVGERRGTLGEKNASLVFNALAQLPSEARPKLICVGGSSELEPELTALNADVDASVVNLDPPELSAFYAGAAALVVTAINEAVNITIVEAMACGCPVIAVRNPTTEAFSRTLAFL